jgi:hypothetical protein
VNKKFTQKDVEVQTLKKFLMNQNSFDLNKLNINTSEPADLEYDGLKYQITQIKDQDFFRELRKISNHNSHFEHNESKTMPERIFTKELLMEALTSTIKNKINFDGGEDVILIIDGYLFQGPFNKEDLEFIIALWKENNRNLVIPWKAVYIAYLNFNIKVY